MVGGRRRDQKLDYFSLVFSSAWRDFHAIVGRETSRMESVAKNAARESAFRARFSPLVYFSPIPRSESHTAYSEERSFDGQ